MKITGPKGPGAVTPPAEEIEGKRSERTGGPSFKEVLDPARGSGATGAAGPIAEITARLKAGEIDAAQASELLVEAVVRSKVAGATPQLQAQLRDTLRRLLTEDPILASKLRSLTRDEK